MGELMPLDCPVQEIPSGKKKERVFCIDKTNIFCWSNDEEMSIQRSFGGSYITRLHWHFNTEGRLTCLEGSIVDNNNADNDYFFRLIETSRLRNFKDWRFHSLYLPNMNLHKERKTLTGIYREIPEKLSDFSLIRGLSAEARYQRLINVGHSTASFIIRALQSNSVPDEYGKYPRIETVAAFDEDERDILSKISNLSSKIRIGKEENNIVFFL